MQSQVEYCLITGASSGIGAAIAKELAQSGRHLGLVARRLERLEVVAATCRSFGATVTVFPCDLTNDERRLQVLQFISEKWPRLDILINNAGFGWYGNLWDMPWSTAQQMIALHNTVLTHLTMTAIDKMSQNDGGTIININSIISNLHVQGSTLYAATKSYEHAFSVAADRELHSQNIRVCCIKPGPVKTEFFHKSAQQKAGARIPGERFAITPERVAKRVSKLIEHPRKQVYLPWYYAFMPIVEPCFGWILDLAGPIILKTKLSTNKR